MNCLKGGGELRCPEDSLIRATDIIYTSFLKMVDELKALNPLPVEVGKGMAETFHRNQAKWHKSCHPKFAPSKLFHI